MIGKLPIADHMDVPAVMDAVQVHLAGDSNDRVRRKQLASRVRHPQESADEYIAALQALANKCRWTIPTSRQGMIEDELARCFIMGVNDTTVQERLLAHPDANYRELCVIMRQGLAARSDIKKLSATVEANAIRTTIHRHPPAQPTTGPAPSATRFTSNNGSTTKPGPCGWCGKARHADRRECPAQGVKCSKCGKLHHLPSVCRATGGQSRPWPKAAAHIADAIEDDAGGEELGALQVNGTINASGRQRLLPDVVQLRQRHGLHVQHPVLGRYRRQRVLHTTWAGAGAGHPHERHQQEQDPANTHTS